MKNNMLMNKVSFREFELRDVDFVYMVKNDKRVNDLIVGCCSSYSYEDALSWVRGCMEQNEGYKYWAICTNDEFQNIVGWCGISEIDYVHKMAAFKTLTIYNPEYRDTTTWYCSWMFVLDYIFYILDFNRVYSIVLTNHKFHMLFFDLFPKSYEGILKNVVNRNGKYEDIALLGLYKKDYELAKEKGDLEYDVLQTYMKDKAKSCVSSIENIEDFIGHIVNLLVSTKSNEINPNTKFRELEDWSSLFAVSMVSVLEEGLHIRFDMCDLNKCDSISDLFELAKKKNAIG